MKTEKREADRHDPVFISWRIQQASGVEGTQLVLNGRLNECKPGRFKHRTPERAWLPRRKAA
ncbi:MAG: hypothetical protein ACRD2L_01500 [Terriglobia bacterium]